MSPSRHRPTERGSRIADDLLEWIVTDVLEEPFRGDDPLAEGVVDSLGYEQLIEYVEATYQVQLDDDDIVAENFESIPALVSLVESKL